MNLKLIYILFIPFYLLFNSCDNSYINKNQHIASKDSIEVNRLIQKGNNLYAKKNSFSAFSESLALYDSAWQIAAKSNDTVLLAKTVFAKGRAYDAINNNPQKTIDYFTQAAKLYGTLPNKKNTTLYIKHLVAHSYDKVQDSASCLSTLHDLYREIITMPDSAKKELPFTTEMALISTVVKNYTFADSILQFLSKREWIKNDSTEYDYLNHYYLTQARINVFLHKNQNSSYIDSVQNVLAQCRNLSDSMYYSSQLSDLYKGLGNVEKESHYLQISYTAFNKFGSPQIIREAKDKIARMEVFAVEAKQKAEAEKAKNRKVIIYLLAILIIAFASFAYFLNGKNKEAKIINQQLLEKNLQNELLNKEMHHRVKNNLELITSLVYMQERNSNDLEVKANMKNISLRIDNIVILHQQLMEQSDVVDLKIYIHRLVENVSNLLDDENKITTYLEIDHILVPYKLSLPLGLIINEWVTNSIKYASSDNGPLKIFLEIIKGDNEINVHYKDNGPPQSTSINKKSLGLDIVRLLTLQLKAKSIINTENLFSYRLTIPTEIGQ